RPLSERRHFPDPGSGVWLIGAGGGGSNPPGGTPLNGTVGATGGPTKTPLAGPPCGTHTPPLTSLAAGIRPGEKKSKRSAIGAVLQPAKPNSTRAAAVCAARRTAWRRLSADRRAVRQG